MARYSDGRTEEFRATSSEQGEFAFSNLLAGRYKVSVQKLGYQYGVEFPPRADDGHLTAFTLANDERRNITIVLPKLAVISGLATDDAGAPLAYVRVYAIPQRMAAQSEADRQTEMYAGPTVFQSATDETGRYLIERVMPGEYLIQTPQVTRAPVTFGPIVRAGADGRPLRIGNGDRISVDLQLHPITGVRVSGTTQPAVHRGYLLLIPRRDQPISPWDPRVISGSVSSDGSFVFPVVPPGDYTLDVISALGMNVALDGAIHQNIALGVPKELEPTVWGTMPLTVGQTPVDNVTMPVRRGIRVSGRIEFVGSGPRPEAEWIRKAFMTFWRTDGGRLLAFQVQIRVDDDGKFVADGLTPGRWRVDASIISDWILKSVVVGGIDVTASSFEVAIDDINDFVLRFNPVR
jgi:hypothetical protein